MSNFQSPLMCVISAFVKYYVHVCKHTVTPPTVSGFFTKLERLRDTHFKKCRALNNLRYYHKFWDVLTSDILFQDIIRSWSIIED